MWFTERQKKALFEALKKVKAELMILGFISLLLTFWQSYIARICLPAWALDNMLPCPSDGENDSSTESRRRLLWVDRRFLAAVTVCMNIIFGCPTHRFCQQGYEPLISVSGLLQLHILIFFLAFFHVLYGAITMMLGRLKVHLAPGSKFNFQKYIKRSLKDDFKAIVGVSPILWASFVVYLVLNVNGWQALFWASLIPLIIILPVGTKLQAILIKMTLEITERHAVVQGIPLVQAADKYFWFGRPQLVLHLIHFALFQNAFQITYFLWIWYSFGLKSCFHSNFKLAIIKASLGVAVLCLCSYITLPLYALVAQMGSSMKKSIFDEQTSRALKKWHMAVKKKTGGHGGKSPGTITLGGSPTSSTLHAGRTLHRFKTTGHSTRMPAYDDHESSDLEADPLCPTSSTTSALMITVDPDHEQQSEVLDEHHHEEETINENDFSFVKPDHHTK